MHGKLNGEGKEWNKNFSFEGKYKDGERESGTLHKEFLTYIGKLKFNQFHGQGKLTLKDGTVYEGGFGNG